MPQLVRIKEGLKHRAPGQEGLLSQVILTGGDLYAASEDELDSFGDKFDVVQVTPVFVSECTAAELVEWVEQGALDAADVLVVERGVKNRKTVTETCETLLSAGDK